MSTTQDAPRFALGQQVRVIANAGGLYAAQIGVVGVIAKQRQKRRYGFRSYDVGYQDARGREKIVIVREDDLEAVEATETAEAAPETASPFRVGDCVVVRPPAADQEDDYPSFTAYPAAGEIVSACLVYAGVHCYDVRFLKASQHDSDTLSFWPAVLIREAHLMPTPVRLPKPAKTTEQPPTFTVGEHVTVDPRSALAYETFTRKGAVGTIVDVGKPVRDIRRYTVRFDVPHLGDARDSRIREAHLVKAEAPAPAEDPRQYARARHAYEYRAEKRLRPGERLWCDKGGCFEDDCVVCQQTPEWRERHGLAPSKPPAPAPKPTLPPTPARIVALSSRELEALAAGDPYEFAVALVRAHLDYGWSPDVVLGLQIASQTVHVPGGACCYEVVRGGVYMTMIVGRTCSVRYALKRLLADAQARIAGVPQQVSLWGSEVSAS